MTPFIYCPQCGQKVVAPGSNFCTKCGLKFASVPQGEASDSYKLIDTSLKFKPSFMDAQTAILSLSKGRLGSFAEYLFGISVPNAVRYNRDGRDFDVNGMRVDVKSSVRLSESMPSFLKRIGARSAGQEYANVIFYKDKVSVHYDNASVRLYAWDEIASILSGWVSENKKTLTTKSDIQFGKEYGDIKSALSSFFSANGYQAKTIYRTSADRFGLSESPGNLLPFL